MKRIRIIRGLLVLLLAATMGVFFYAGCSSGVDGLSGGIHITPPSLSGSGTADDPYLVFKGTPFGFEVKNDSGNAINADWAFTSLSVGSDIGKSSDNQSFGTFSVNTLTPPTKIPGSGILKLTATSPYDSTASDSTYIMYVVPNNISFDAEEAFVPNSGYSFEGGNIAASKGMADILLTQTQTSGDATQAETMLNTYLTDVSSSFTSIPVASPITPVIQGLPAAYYPISDNFEWSMPSRIFIDPSSNICFVTMCDHNNREYAYESDNCTVTDEAVVWNGPFYIADESQSSPIANGSSNGDVMVDASGNVHFAWVYPSENGNLYYEKCQPTDDGYSCGMNKQLTTDSLHMGWYRPYIKTFGDKVYIAWNASGGAKLVYSNDGGATFSEPITGAAVASLISMTIDTSGKLYLSTTGKLFTYTNGDSEFVEVSALAGDTGPGMYMDGQNNIHIAYVKAYHEDAEHPTYVTRSELIYSKSTDLGATWSSEYVFPEIDITDSNPELNPGAFIVGSGSDVYIVYTSDYRQSVYFVVSRDGGSNWDSPVRAVNLNYDKDTSEPSYIHITPDPIYATVDGLYIPWGTDARLTFCSRTGVCNVSQHIGPSAPVSEAKLFRLSYGITGNDNYGVVWPDGRNGNFDIYYSSNAYGTSPNTNGYRVSTSRYNDVSPNAAVGPDGTIHAVWFSIEDNDNERAHLYYSKSTDGGIDWATPTRLTDSTTELWTDPLIAVDALNRVHVAWPDDHACFSKSCQWEFSIYYRRLENGNWSNVSVAAPPAPIMNLPAEIVTSSNGTAYIGNQKLTSYDGVNLVIEDDIIVVSADDPSIFEERIIPINGVIDFFGEGYIGSANLMLNIDRFDRITASWVRSQVGGASVNYAITSPDNGIYFSRSANGGITWSDPALVTPPIPEGQAAAFMTSHMTTDENGRVYILYGYGEGEYGEYLNFNAYLAIGE